MTDGLHLPNDPDPDADPLEERIREAHAPLFREMVALEEEASQAPLRVDDDAGAEALTALAGRIQRTEKAFETAKTAEKEPFLVGGRTIDQLLGGPPKTLKTRRDALMSRVNAHHDRKRAEAQRLAQEEATRQREEALRATAAAEAARAAESHQEADQLAQDAAKAEQRADAQEQRADRQTTATTRTESGATSYQVHTKTFRITDAEAFRASFGPMVHYLDKAAVAAALGRAANADPLPTVPGVEFYTQTETRVRNAAAKGA